MQTITTIDLAAVTGGATDQRSPFPPGAQQFPGHLGELAKPTDAVKGVAGRLFPPWYEWPTTR